MILPMIICFDGPSGPDKDAVARGLCNALTESGLKVGLVRHGVEAEPETCQAEMEIGPGGFTFRRKGGAGVGQEELAALYMEGLDVVISEDACASLKYKIEFVPMDGEPELLEDSNLKALVAAGDMETDKPVFSPRQVDELAGFIRDNLLPQRTPQRIRVLINGKRLPIKEFVQDFVANTIRAMIASLRGGDKPGKISVFMD